MYYDDKEEMLDAAARQLHQMGVVWPTINDVMNKTAPTPPNKWQWRVRPGVAFPYLHYERSDIILVPSRFHNVKGR